MYNEIRKLGTRSQLHDGVHNTHKRQTETIFSTVNRTKNTVLLR